MATFPGRVGDILWSLATVAHLATSYGTALDFYIMPRHAAILPLLNIQPYIRRADVIDDWPFSHSSCGDQPWKPPAHIENWYERFWHLGYRSEPQVPLIDFIASQHNLKLSSPVPFIFADGPKPIDGPYIVSGIGNPQDYWPIQEIMKALHPVPFVNLTVLPWLESARFVKHASAFIGSRSANFVLAHGFGIPVVAYEMDIVRRHPNFTSPYRLETLLPLAPPETVQVAIEALRRVL
jgi:hypothetical protein